MLDFTDDRIDAIWESVPDCDALANYADQRKFARAILAQHDLSLAKIKAELKEERDSVRRLLLALAPLAACHLPPEGREHLGMTAHFQTADIARAKAVYLVIRAGVISADAEALIGRNKEQGDGGEV